MSRITKRENGGQFYEDSKINMKIYCKFDQAFDAFLKEVVNYAMSTYCEKLNISTLKEIELVLQSEFPYSTDGKMIDETKIVLTDRLYKQIPTLDINDLVDNSDFKIIVSTIVHEMGHINDKLAMPSLYSCVSESEDEKELVIVLFWLEYLADKKSYLFGLVDDSQLCYEIATNKWNINKSSMTSDFNTSNFVYLNKVLPYFMARTTDETVRQKYYDDMVNPFLKAYIQELTCEISILEKKLPFDNVELLYDLYEIMNKYYKKFMGL